MSWLRDLRRVREGDVRSPLAGVLLLIFVLISWLIAIALVAGWIGSIVWMAIAEGAGAAIVAFLVGVFVLLVLVPLATVLLYPQVAGIIGAVVSFIDRLDIGQQTSPAVEAPSDDEKAADLEAALDDAYEYEHLYGYTKSGRKTHILIDGRDNLALCGRECERRIKPEDATIRSATDSVDMCDICWRRETTHRRHWARKLRG